MIEEEKKKKISDLCQESMDEKWHGDSHYRVGDMCSFCDDCNNCEGCLCPPEICAHSGHEGHIHTLMEKYSYETLVKDISKADLKYMQSLFQKHIEDEK